MVLQNVKWKYCRDHSSQDSAICWGSVVLPSSFSRTLLSSRALLWLIPVCYEQSSFPQPVFSTNQPGSPARSNQAGRLGTDEQSVMQEFELEFGFCSSWIWLWLDQCRCKHKPRWLKFHQPGVGAASDCLGADEQSGFRLRVLRNCITLVSSKEDNESDNC